MPSIKSPDELEAFRKNVLSNRDPSKPSITLCSGTACHATGSKEVAAAFEQELEQQGMKTDINFRKTGCHGFCEKGPIVIIDPEEICYLQVTPKDVPDIIGQTIKEKKVLDHLLYTDAITGEKTALESEIPFYKHQQRNVFGPNRRIDPRSIEDYIAIGGFQALPKALL
ncbi:MAG: NADH-quinone oxidoreductase subunit F, partial [Deltaproteobacteria bacterium]|nr:NADH-quinone oxidoreductase subunit F [Deltaproteobacteria bacterium]